MRKNCTSVMTARIAAASDVFPFRQGNYTLCARRKRPCNGHEQHKVGDKAVANGESHIRSRLPNDVKRLYNGGQKNDERNGEIWEIFLLRFAEKEKRQKGERLH